MSTASAGALDVIAASPGITVTEIARLWPTSQQSVSQLVAGLHRSGFVERRLIPGGRGVPLFVTAAGRRALRDANSQLDAIELSLATSLGNDERAQLIELLGHMRSVLAQKSRRSSSVASSSLSAM
jgi:DNA-binding MarR family transcriptional regulator